MNEDPAGEGRRFVVPDPPLTDGVVSLVPFMDVHVDALERAALDPEIARRFEKPQEPALTEWPITGLPAPPEAP